MKINYYAIRYSKSDLLNQEVIIIHSEKKIYKDTFGRHGIIKNTSGNQVGVLIDDLYNPK